MSGKPIRVLVVDDSALMRKMIPQLLLRDRDIEVVGTAMDGLFALKKIRDLRPDVITLDIDMPRMDGIETLRRIMAEFGTPTVMVSSLAKQDADLTFQALEIGAFDYVAKPHDAVSVHIAEIASDLIAKVKAAYENPLAQTRKPKSESTQKLPQKSERLVHKTAAENVLAIGISTGGPNALAELLPTLPADFPAAVLIVQHMPEGFTEMFAARLNAHSAVEVREARDGDLVQPGRVLIAPGNRHLKVKRLSTGTIAVLSDAPPVSGHRPSADVLFRSVADEYGVRAMGLIMTGMGDDGADGIGEIRARGGRTVAQDEASCVVYGMPKAAIERKQVTDIVPLGILGSFLINHFMQREVKHDD